LQATPGQLMADANFNAGVVVGPAISKAAALQAMGG
jgi:hypothetical protein